MTADNILVEAADNFAVDNAAVIGVSITQSGDSGSDAPSKPTTKLKIESSAGKHHLETERFTTEWVDLLRAALGERVRCKTSFFG